MATHAKGPWQIERDPSGGIGIYATHRDGSAGPKVAEVPVNALDSASETEAEGLANATLITAAPDLLAACVEVLVLAEGGPGAFHEMKSMIGRIHAAVAKATGAQ